MELKRCLMAVAVAVLFFVPLGSSTDALASGARSTHPGPASHEDGDESGEAGADDPGGHGNKDGARNPSRHEDSGDEDADDQRAEGSCTSVSSVAICADEPGIDEPMN